MSSSMMKMRRSMLMQQRTGAATDHRAGTRQYAVATTTMLMFVVSVALAMMGHVVFVTAGAEDSIATAAAVAVAVPACSFPNTSMVSFESCPHFEGESMVSQMELCLPFLLDEETTPSADCCGSVSNVSSGLPACFCKVTFYPPRMVNITQQKRLASFCNVTTDLCQTCPQYLVNRTYTRPDWMDRPFWTARGGPRFHLVAKVAEYKTTAIWLAVLLALTYVGIAVTAAFVVHKRWKAKKAAASALLETKMSAFPSANLTHPGSDF
ncbi:unnamed protein product [Sphagnum troendelagicum]|uniref:Bifunctional inhibitor/plant lipid transfer protein/seed storage helical domain-containing protein n=1 Tax=Sphagnum troendelagicum TaxID=128251 RepID=A0ABP0TMP4_9BRYO